MATSDDVFQTLRLLVIAMWGRKPGPVSWETVPGEVQRHFRFSSEDDESVIKTG